MPILGFGGGQMQRPPIQPGRLPVQQGRLPTQGGGLPAPQQRPPGLGGMPQQRGISPQGGAASPQQQELIQILAQMLSNLEGQGALPPVPGQPGAGQPGLPQGARPRLGAGGGLGVGRQGAMPMMMGMLGGQGGVPRR